MPSGVDEASHETDALDDAIECIGRRVGKLMEDFARNLGKPAFEIRQVQKRAKVVAQRAALGVFQPFFPKK